MNEDFAMLLFLFGITLTTSLAFGAAWFRAARRVRRLEDQLARPLAAEDPRVERLEQALDSVASQLDQLASGQEFLNRVISDRARRLPERAPIITPH